MNILNMVYTLHFFFSSKCSLFHNSNVFGSCVIHILHTGCAKITKKKNSGAKSLTKDAKMCMMIRGAADRLWWTKILYVQLKRRLGITDDSPLRHFPCIFLKFHGHFFTKMCLRSKKPLPLALHRRRHHSRMKGYKKLVQRYNRCLNNGGNYVEN